jgi:hypothetical protein
LLHHSKQELYMFHPTPSINSLQDFTSMRLSANSAGIAFKKERMYDGNRGSKSLDLQIVVRLSLKETQQRYLQLAVY